MSGALLFLLGFLVVATVGGLLLWLRDHRPRAWDSEMDEFSRTLRALSPDAPLAPEEGRRRPPGGPRRPPSRGSRAG